MPSSLHIASSPASIASTSPPSGRPKRVDFVTGYCGLSRPTLSERIASISADGDPAKTTPTRIASGPAARLDNRRRMEVAKPSSRPVMHRPIREPMSARAGPDGCGHEHWPRRLATNTGGDDEHSCFPAGLSGRVSVDISVPSSAARSMNRWIGDHGGPALERSRLPSRAPPGGETFDKCWTLRCLLFRWRRAAGEKLCRAPAGIQSFAL